jgi:hypothetical protein
MLAKILTKDIGYISISFFWAWIWIGYNILFGGLDMDMILYPQIKDMSGLWYEE